MGVDSETANHERTPPHAYQQMDLSRSSGCIRFTAGSYSGCAYWMGCFLTGIHYSLNVYLVAPHLTVGIVGCEASTDKTTDGELPLLRMEDCSS